ncbi:hypothetical protein [Streptomyces pilosus]|nr:hypothetical protein [Streptomyces pilosus]
MATTRTMTLLCSTCGGPHQHRLMTPQEQARAKQQLGLRAVYDLWLCENVVDAESGRRCRTLRRWGRTNPFPSPVKLLPPE